MRNVRVARAAATLLCASALITGCVPASDSDASPSFLEEVLSGTSSRPPTGPEIEESEPNDEPASATPVPIDGTVELVGTIAPGAAPYDRDFFDLGPAAPGDEILGTLNIADGSDILLAVLDDQQRQIAYVDQSTTSAGPSELQVVVREATTHLYVVLATRSGASTRRSYTAAITLQRAVGLPEYRPQIVVLDFDGQRNVSIAGRPAVDVPEFDAARIDARYADDTSIVIASVLQMVRETYDGVGVEFYLAGDPLIPAGPRSTLYFGTFDSRLLGLAENVDPYNADLEQQAILYTDTFAIFSALSPDVDAISQVLANTASHEIGHLLGLRHTADPHDIMDTTATARQMLLRQWFRYTALNETVLPVGFQDAPSLLSWTLGGLLRPEPNPKAVATRQKTLASLSAVPDFHVPRATLMSGCDHQ